MLGTHSVSNHGSFHFLTPNLTTHLIQKNCANIELVRLPSAWLISTYFLSHNTIRSTS
jgi:hypothetical protein